MREELSREKMHKAIDSAFSGLNGDPWLFQRISARAAEGEIRVKKKLSAGLVLAIVLVLLAAAALAVTLLTHKEIVEQVAVPLALENDTETPGVNPVYSKEQLAEIVRILNENGITFEENSSVMQHLQNNLGYYEGSLFAEICQKAFGEDYGSWTPEQQDWYDEIQYRMVHTETLQSHVPGEDNMTPEKAETYALAKLREEYGPDLPLEDRNIWNLSSDFYKADDSEPEDHWSFTFWPKDMEHGYYNISFNDRNPDESVATYAQFMDWSGSFTGNELWSAFTYLYGDERNWPQSVWQKFHEQIQNAETDPNGYFETDYAGYQLTAYPEPCESDISREEAIRIAKNTVNLKRAAFDSAVLTEYEGERTWLVTLVIHQPLDYSEDEEAGSYVVSIDSMSGSVLSKRKPAAFEDSSAMSYIAEAAYEKTRKSVLKQSDMIPLAVKAIRDEYPWLGDPLDENEYFIPRRLNDADYIEFVSMNPQHGDVDVWFTPDGTVDFVAVDRARLNGDNLFSRYRNAYGYFSDWDQSKWVQLEQDMKELNPELLENKLLKVTHYPEESSVSIQHVQAQELGIKASGKRTANVSSSVLVDARPHPVWIVFVDSSDACTCVIGIDAETGETVFSLPYITGFTPSYVFYSMPETWRRMELEAGGAPYAARMAIGRKFYEQDHDVSDFQFKFWYQNWDLQVDGLTVRYISRWKDRMDYEVELDENGNVLRCECSESISTEEEPDSPPNGKPWIWDSDFAPKSYWELLEKVITSHDTDFSNLHVSMGDWLDKYGPVIKETWPSDLYALAYVLTKITPSDLSSGSVFYPDIYPRKEKIERDEAVEIAVGAFNELAESQYGPDWMNQFRYTCMWESSVYYDHFLISPCTDVWAARFFCLEDRKSVV